MSDRKINIAVAGGPCTGKSVLAANLFARLKTEGLDYDLISEESRKLRSEFGHPRNPFDRFYLWRQQEREELRSIAVNGFITDTILFKYYVDAVYHSAEPRDNLAVRELFRMCQEVLESGRYGLIIVHQNPFEIAYKKDASRSADEGPARERHRLMVNFLELFTHPKILYISGELEERLGQVLEKVRDLHSL
jgi:nicotinamide riboside kinase